MLSLLSSKAGKLKRIKKRFQESPVSSPTSDFTHMSSGSVTDSTIMAAGMDITTWAIVDILVPAGPLGIYIDGSFSDAALLDDYAPATDDGLPGTIEMSGKVPPGSVLVGIDKLDFLQSPRKNLADIGDILRATSHLQRLLRFKVPPKKIESFEIPTLQDSDKSKLIIVSTSSSTVEDSEDSNPANTGVSVPHEVFTKESSPMNPAQESTVLSAPVIQPSSTKVTEQSSAASPVSTTAISSSRRMSAASMERRRLALLSIPKFTEDTELRRRLELQLILSYDRKELKFQECWFAVHSEWINTWALFVGKGGHRPGPITNHKLLVPGFPSGNDPNRTVNVLPELELIKDFRFVTPMVWSLLAALHGPGEAPPIARFVLDINSESPEDINEVLREVKSQADGLAAKFIEKCQVQKE